MCEVGLNVFDVVMSVRVCWICPRETPVVGLLNPSQTPDPRSHKFRNVYCMEDARPGHEFEGEEGRES